MTGWLQSIGNAMKCERPPGWYFCTHPVCDLCVLWVTCSFAKGNMPAWITQAYDIDSKTIAERFESISGTQIYGVSNWREWCSLESLTPCSGSVRYACANKRMTI